MANTPAITLEIGAAVNPNVGAALNATKDSTGKAQGKLGTAVGLDDSISAYLEAAARLEDARREKASGISDLQSVMDRHLNTLRAQGIEVKGLGDRYQALGEAIKGYRLQAQGLEQIAQGRAGLTAIPGLVKVAAKPVKVSGDYQAQLRDIRLRTGMDAASEAQVSQEVIAASRSTGMSRSQVVQLLGQLLDKGMSLQTARENLPTAATFAVGQKASLGDTAALMRSLQQAKLDSPDKVREALNLLVTQSKEGAFDSAELAKWVAKLLPGMKDKPGGLETVGELGALLQAQMSNANGTDEAGEKVKAYLEANRKVDEPAKEGKGQDKTASAAEDPKRFTGDHDVFQRLRKPAGLSTTALEDDLKGRQDLSRQKWSQSGDALDDLQRSLGDGMRPVTDVLADGATYALRKLTDLADTCPTVVTGLTAVAATVAAVAVGYRGWQVGKGVLDLGRGLFKERSALKQDGLPRLLEAGAGATPLGTKQPVDVRVVNFDMFGRSRRAGKGKRGAARKASTASTGTRSASSPRERAGQGTDPRRRPDANASPSRRRDLPPAESARSVSTGDHAEPRGRVTTRGWTGAPPGASGFAGATNGVSAQRAPFSVMDMNRAGPALASADNLTPGAGKLAPVPHALPATVPGAAMAHLPGVRMGGVLGTVGRGVLKRLPGASLLDAGMQIVQTYRGNGSREEKLEGYGTAVGGLGGALAGAAAGAAIGSVVPVVGTAIGGLIGGVLGGAGGENLGGWLAKAWSSVSGPTQAPANAAVSRPSDPVGAVTRNLDSAATVAQLPPANPPAAPLPVPPAPINQQFTFTANMPVTFSNSLDDPTVLQQLEAIARRQLEELMRQARSVQLADTPHIAL